MVRRAISIAGGMVLICFLLLTGCTERQAVIGIESPEAKISPTLLGVVSVFMTIRNTGNAEDHLMNARTVLPGTVVEMHDIVDGKMVKVDGIQVPADSRVVLRAARHHVMIYKMPREMMEGAEFDLILTFKRSGERTVHCTLSSFSSQKLLRK